jgi:hypothetical protein
MATKSKSKALKARAAAKAQPRKRKDGGDAVSVLLATQRKLIAALEGTKQRAENSRKHGRKSDGTLYDTLNQTLFDRVSGNSEELSWLIPKTNEGAIFTLAVAYASLSDLATVQDADFRARRQRRGFRLLYALLTYLVGQDIGDRCDDPNNEMIRFYMPPWHNPFTNLAWVGSATGRYGRTRHDRYEGRRGGDGAGRPCQQAERHIGMRPRPRPDRRAGEGRAGLPGAADRGGCRRVARHHEPHPRQTGGRRMTADIIAIPRGKGRLTPAQRRMLREEAARCRAAASTITEAMLRWAGAMERAAKLGQLAGDDRDAVESVFGEVRFRRFQQM